VYFQELQNGLPAVPDSALYHKL